MTQTPINFAELVAEVATEVRQGMDLDQAITEIASDYDANPAVLRARVERAFPEGITAALPCAKEMEARRVADIRAHNARVRAEIEAINEFFQANPDMKLAVRQNITRFTGKRSCNMHTAKAIADKLVSA